ncbi:hypothetical protein A2U01_0053179, partial [Trifolium medium]|nr:hypothetical protein [Trifolium medium]
KFDSARLISTPSGGRRPTSGAPPPTIARSLELRYDLTSIRSSELRTNHCGPSELCSGLPYKGLLELYRLAWTVVHHQPPPTAEY